MEICVGSYDSYVVGLRTQVKETDDISNGIALVTSFTDNSHMGCIKDIQISPHGRILASASSDETIHLFNLKKRRDMGSLFLHDGTVSCVRFSGRDTLYSASEDGTIAVWNTGSWQCVGRLKTHKAAVNSMAVHPNGKLALSVGRDKQIVTWNLTTCKPCFQRNIGKVAHIIEWSQQGTFFAVVSQTDVDVYETSSARLIASLPTPKVVNSLTFLTDDQFAVAGELGEVQVYGIAAAVPPTKKAVGRTASVRSEQQEEADDNAVGSGVDTVDFEKPKVGGADVRPLPSTHMLKKLAFVAENERIRAVCCCTAKVPAGETVEATFICAALSNGFVKVWRMPTLTNEHDAASKELIFVARYNLACRLTCITARSLTDADLNTGIDAEVESVVGNLKEHADELWKAVREKVADGEFRTNDGASARLPLSNKEKISRSLSDKHRKAVVPVASAVTPKSLKRRQSLTPEEVMDAVQKPRDKAIRNVKVTSESREMDVDDDSGPSAPVQTTNYTIIEKKRIKEPTRKRAKR